MQGQVVAQFLVVVEIFIAQCQGVNPLPEEFLLRVIATGLPPVIGNRFGHCLGQAHLLVDLCEESDTAIAGDITAPEISFNFTTFN